jgi:hypothetical protein
VRTEDEDLCRKGIAEIARVSPPRASRHTSYERKTGMRFQIQKKKMASDITHTINAAMQKILRSSTDYN